ncbi:MAG: hypothetical protein PHX08_02245 [Lachnospiraceae bacterium]|nr:hypothetical protein [Lachnospiraceae bacterium]
MSRIYVTLDTEMDSDEHWGKHYPPEYSSILEGIPRLLRPIWDKHEVHPIYFVSPEVLYEEKNIEILKSEVEKGAIIGAHLHPEYIEPDSIFGKEMEKAIAKFPCSEYPNEIEKEKLIHLTELIEKTLGVKPEWYRAARFGADIDTIQILRELGYKHDSSVTPHINWASKGGPDHSGAPTYPYVIADKDMYQESTTASDNRIWEHPVTIYGRRWGFMGKLLPDNWLFYRWLRPTHMTYVELKGIIKQMVREKRAEGVMMFHSMEIMIHKTPYVRAGWMQKYYLWRLEKSLGYARKKGYEL